MPNITSALDDLIEVRPQLVIQLAKAGTSKQARKRYKVTVAGAKKVQELSGPRCNGVVRIPVALDGADALQLEPQVNAAG